MKTDILLMTDHVEIKGDRVLFKNSGDKQLAFFDVRNGNLVLGGEGGDGDLVVKNKKDEDRILLDGGGGPIADSVRVHIFGDAGALRLGGDGKRGFFRMLDKAGENSIVMGGSILGLGSSAGFVVDAHIGSVRVGAPGKTGTLELRGVTADKTISLSGLTGKISGEEIRCERIVINKKPNDPEVNLLDYAKSLEKRVAELEEKLK